MFIYRDDDDHFYGLPGGRDGEVPGAVKLGEHMAVQSPQQRAGTVPSTRQFAGARWRSPPGGCPAWSPGP
jgi:hypothetical protein